MRENIVAKKITGDKRKDNASPVTHVEGLLNHAVLTPAVSLIRTKNSMIEKMIPIPAMSMGKMIERSIETISRHLYLFRSLRVQYNGSKYGSHIRTEKVGTMPATSPTLSPTLSAMVAGLRGSSSGILLLLYHKVGTHIGCLRIDTSAHAREKRDGFGSQ
jgi:hypothetical protein